MKKTFITLLAVAGFTTAVNAQEKERVSDKDLPATIQNTFKSTFPDAKDAEWKMKEGYYKVEFEVNDVDQIAAFDASGKLVSKGVEIRENELPEAVRNAVQTAHSGRTIDDAYKMEKEGNTHYMVKLDGNPPTKLMYSADGQEIREKH